MLIDEGPSSEDLDRFGGGGDGGDGEETGFCPECGAEVWDQADVCPKCGTYMSGGVSRRKPIEREIQRKLIVVIIALTLIAFLLISVF